jgi:hypothetical protein
MRLSKARAALEQGQSPELVLVGSVRRGAIVF